MTCSMCKCTEHKMGPNLQDRDPEFFKYMCSRYPGFEINNSFPLTYENGNLKKRRSKLGITVYLCPNCISSMKYARKEHGVIAEIIDKVFFVDNLGSVIYNRDAW